MLHLQLHFVLTVNRYFDIYLIMKTQGIFEALTDPNRRKILDLLKKTEELSVGEIAQHFSISNASLSHHLSKLKATDLVVTRREGQSIYYSINTSVFEDFATVLMQLFKDRGKNGKSR